MVPMDDPRQILAQRLRAFRSEQWPGVTITQPMLSVVLGVKVPSVSSWESANDPKIPPIERLEVYATIFATRRSLHNGKLRLFALSDLTQDERTQRDRIKLELLALRAAALGHSGAGVVMPNAFTGNPWHFPDGKPVTLICAQLPRVMRERMPYANPEDPDYIELYTYTDLDALFELHGHIRAANPDTDVRLRVAQHLSSDDYTEHLVLLGGIDWNTVTRNVLERIALPVRQVGEEDGGERGYFEAGGQPHYPKLSEDGALQEDVALFYRGPNPFNRKRTVSMCNGMYGRGVYGAVRALTDRLFRDRNTEYLTSRFANRDSYGILSRVSIENGTVVTPDWTQKESRLHEWPPADHP